MFNRKGSILIASYLVLFVLLILCGAFFSRVLSDKKLFDISRERSEAFQLAEAAVDTGLAGLKANYGGYTGTGGVVAFGRGEFEATVSTISSTQKKITAYGYVPSKAYQRGVRKLEVITKRDIPANFFNHAIYSAGELEFQGNSYTVNGDVIYGSTFEGVNRITGTVTHDPSVAPLARFDFSALRAIAAAQGNLYDAARLDLVRRKQASYPSNFWYIPPTNPLDPTTGTPNVVYIEGDMVLNGNFGTAAGFCLVVGNVLTDPNATSDATINGNGTVNGAVYTLGEFEVNGGGSGLNVNGGIWSGHEAELKGNATVTYNTTYMQAIQYLVNGLGAQVQILSWREVE